MCRQGKRSPPSRHVHTPVGFGCRTGKEWSIDRQTPLPDKIRRLIGPYLFDKDGILEHKKEPLFHKINSCPGIKSK